MPRVAERRAPESPGAEHTGLRADGRPARVERLERIREAATRCVATFDEGPCAGNTSVEAVQDWSTRASDAISALRRALREEEATPTVDAHASAADPDSVADAAVPERGPLAAVGTLPPVTPPPAGGLCARCGQHLVHRSRAWTRTERLASWLTPLRLYRCHGCHWRGWLLRRPAPPLAAAG